MKFSNTLALVALCTSTVSAFDLIGAFKGAFNILPNKVTKPSGDDDILTNSIIKKWDGKLSGTPKKGKDSVWLKHFKTKKVNKKDFTPLFIAKNHARFAGIYAQNDCTDNDKIEGKKLKDAMFKSLKDSKIYTVRCGGEVKVENMA